MKRIFVALFAAALLSPAALSAQQPQPQPGVIVVSSQKCNMGTLDELNTYFRNTMAPVLNELVKEGKLLGWGVMEHMWGDEWNHVIYYLAPDVPTFHNAFTEGFGRMAQRDPNIMKRIAQYCTEHKDNIYNVVMTQATPAAPAR